MKNHAAEALPEPQESFAALSAAVHPAWHQAIIRLANASERVAFRLEAFMGTPIDGGMARHARELVKDLIDFLDQLEADPDLEPSAGGSCTDECEEIGDTEPSLGSLDRAINQEQWSKGHSWGPGDADLELDRSDDEPALGATENHPSAPAPIVIGHKGPGASSHQYRDNSGSQVFWSLSGRDDREDEVDTGIGDQDGLLEQVGAAWKGGGMA
ncbi:hypothetical protein [Bradyrhizobium sp. CCBAU 53338]|uniref:hypothetical protein n=1 Tax=Bradyrhizobium sp. CCBAU 53338 TaxID=1325111 RepID=UPI00188D1A21|nr:hypothetical protein [Bradyrhizobium sp. CCBAU 53338]QOZ52881.1 hypothetical protein XH90_17055 [Bradyrhizobium sp. CCBAU 53338]